MVGCLSTRPLQACSSFLLVTSLPGRIIVIPVLQARKVILGAAIRSTQVPQPGMGEGDPGSGARG